MVENSSFAFQLRNSKAGCGNELKCSKSIPLLGFCPPGFLNPNGLEEENVTIQT